MIEEKEPLVAYRIAQWMVLILMLANTAAAQQVVDRIVAVVNGEMITLGELNAGLAQLQDQLPVQPTPQAQEAMLQQVRESLLQARINDILIRHEIERLKLNVDPADIESRIRAFREEHDLTEEELRSQLALLGKTRAQFMEELKRDILKTQLINYMVHRKVVVTDQDVDEFIASGGRASALAVPSASPSPAAAVNTSRVRLAVIMVNDEAAANRIYKDVTGGRLSFAAAAKQFSVGPAAEDGGDMGELALVDLGAALRKALDGLRPGDISKPFRLEASFALVHLLEQGAGPARAPSLPATSYDRQAIRAQLHKAKTETVFLEYLAKLKSKALIKINW